MSLIFSISLCIYFETIIKLTTYLKKNKIIINIQYVYVYNKTITQIAPWKMIKGM